MKKSNLIFALGWLSVVSLLLMGYSSQHPTGATGYTGAPGDGACTQCHTPGSNIMGMTEINDFPLAITPGTTYPLKVIITNTNGGAVRAGFQMVAIKNTSFGNAGNFAIPAIEDSASVKQAGGKYYAGHKPAKYFPSNDVVTYDVDWTPLSSLTVDATLYMAANIANGNQSNSGDKIIFSSYPAPLAKNIAPGIMDQCQSTQSVNISGQGFVDILDNQGNIVCSIDPQGNNLGMVSVDFFVTTNDRIDDNGVPYMNRNVTITPTNQPQSPVKIRIYYTMDEYNALLAADQTIVNYKDIDFTKSDNVCSAFNGGNNVTFVPQTNSGWYGNGIFIEADISSFSSFYANGQDIALPVIWEEPLSVSSDKKTIKLLWAVSQEFNVDRNVIEHSNENRIFRSIGEVKAPAPKDKKGKYSFSLSKNELSPGMHYFRIKQIDLDGKFSYSNTVSLKLEDHSIKYFPNPVDQYLTVNNVDKGMIKIMDYQGKLVLVQKIIAGQTTIDVSGLKPGIYLIGNAFGWSKMVKL